MSQTGANADYRLRLRPDAQLAFVLSLLNEVLFVKMQGSLEPGIRELVMPYSLGQFGQSTGSRTASCRGSWATSGARRPICRVRRQLSPGKRPRRVNYLNEVLGNGELYGPAQAAAPFPASSSQADFDHSSLDARGIRRRHRPFERQSCVPAPRALGYEEALGTVPLSVALVESEDETSVRCTATLPDAPCARIMGDFEARSQVYSLRQPVVCTALRHAANLRGRAVMAGKDVSYSETFTSST